MKELELKAYLESNINYINQYIFADSTHLECYQEFYYMGLRDGYLYALRYLNEKGYESLNTGLKEIEDKAEHNVDIWQEIRDNLNCDPITLEKYSDMDVECKLNYNCAMWEASKKTQAKLNEPYINLIVGKDPDEVFANYD